MVIKFTAGKLTMSKPRLVQLVFVKMQAFNTFESHIKVQHARTMSAWRRTLMIWWPSEGRRVSLESATATGGFMPASTSRSPWRSTKLYRTRTSNCPASKETQVELSNNNGSSKTILLGQLYLELIYILLNVEICIKSNANIDTTPTADEQESVPRKNAF